MVARSILFSCLLQTEILLGGVQTASAETSDALQPIPECAGINEPDYSPQACDAAAGAWLLDCLSENHTWSRLEKTCNLEPRIESCGMRSTLAYVACYETMGAAWATALHAYSDITAAEIEALGGEYADEKLERFNRAALAYQAFKESECDWQAAFKLGAREESIDTLICAYRMDQQRKLKLIDQLSYLR